MKFLVAQIFLILITSVAFADEVSSSEYDIGCFASPSGNEEHFFPVIDLDAARLEGEKLFDEVITEENSEISDADKARHDVMRQVVSLLSDGTQFPSCASAGGSVQTLWYYPVIAACMTRDGDSSSKTEATDEQVYNRTSERRREAVQFLRDKCTEESEKYPSGVVYFRETQNILRDTESPDPNNKYEMHQTSVACCLAKGMATPSATATASKAPATLLPGIGSTISSPSNARPAAIGSIAAKKTVTATPSAKASHTMIPSVSSVISVPAKGTQGAVSGLRTASPSPTVTPGNTLMPSIQSSYSSYSTSVQAFSR